MVVRPQAPLSGPSVDALSAAPPELGSHVLAMSAAHRKEVAELRRELSSLNSQHEKALQRVRTRRIIMVAAVGLPPRAAAVAQMSDATQEARKLRSKVQSQQREMQQMSRTVRSWRQSATAAAR